MKFTICFVTILFSFFWCFCRNSFEGDFFGKTVFDTIHYDRVKTLNRFCSILNEVKKHYGFDSFPIEFTLKNGKPAGFFVYDLVDTTNNSVSGSIRFEEGHVYHFAPGYLYYSISNICILKEGKLIFFKGLNCKKNINDIQDVIKSLKLYLPNSLESEKIINRTLNYRKYGRYLKVDSSVCKCEI